MIVGFRNEKAKLFRQNCNCIPACTSITYKSDFDRAKYDWNKAMVSTNRLTYDSRYFVRQFFWNYFRLINGNFSSVHRSRVSISFTSHEVSAFRREEQYSDTDFLAICGGILGLCLGVSALSIIEFIYFATLRMFWSLRELKSENVVVPFKPSQINHISIDMPNE